MVTRIRPAVLSMTARPTALVAITPSRFWRPPPRRSCGPDNADRTTGTAEAGTPEIVDQRVGFGTVAQLFVGAGPDPCRRTNPRTSRADADPARP